MKLFALVFVVALAVSWGTPARACATCACSDPALVGVGGARPSAGRVRVGSDVRWLASSSEVGVLEDVRAVRVGILADVTIVDGIAIDVQVPLVAAHRTAAGFGAFDSSFADADVALRGILLADREIAPREYAGLRAGLLVPMSVLGRDPRGSRLDTGAWAPHAELFGTVVRDRWFVSGALGGRFPLGEDIGGRDYQRGPVANAAVRGQLQPRPELGVFVALSGEAAADARMAGAHVDKTGGARALVTSGISSVIAEDIFVELAATVPVVQTQPEKLGAMIALSVTFDVGKR